MTKAEAGKLGYLKAKETIQQKAKDNRENYEKNPKLCKYCEKPLDYDKRRNNFCNHSCSASFNNQGVQRQGLDKVECICEYCGKYIGNFPQSNIKKYCYAKCWGLSKREITKEKIIRGECSHNKTLKRYLVEERGDKCEICGIREWKGKPLVKILDHIDGNSENNFPENLRLVCSNCDSQLETYKIKNKGKGRYKRKQRYKEGKSY